MNWHAVQHHWKTYAPAIRASWSELTDDDLEEIGGDRIGLASLIHERYGVPKPEAERQIESWLIGR